MKFPQQQEDWSTNNNFLVTSDNVGSAYYTLSSATAMQ